MEATNLQTAATYVNNLLLARGLLRNGKPVKFGELATHVPRQEHNGSKEQTLSATTIVADIINLVHDMLLKRDVGPASLYDPSGFANVLKEGPRTPRIACIHFAIPTN